MRPKKEITSKYGECKRDYDEDCREDYYMNECYCENYDKKHGYSEDHENFGYHDYDKKHECRDYEKKRECREYDKKHECHDYDKKYEYHDYDKKYECYDYDKKCSYHDYDKKPEKKLIQTKVIKGKGCEDFFLEADFTIPSGSEELYLIESVTTWVEVYDAKVVCDNKVIFNAWVYKNIIYKGFGEVETPAPTDGVTVTGPVQHITKAIPLAGCINIDTKNCGKLNPCEDIAEVIKARVIGEVDDRLDETEVDNSGVSYNPPVFTYGRIHEKMCVRIEVKVVRWEHVSVEIQDKC